jgi:CubicO group peptidase (beta-lactamase class C family)
MNSGLQWIEDYASICDATSFSSRRHDSSAIRKPAEYKPNMKWNYSSGTTNLLSGILRNSSNKNIG